MRFKTDNRGFTLVELIVSTAILSIVALAASTFMIAGTRTYSSLNYTVRLQYEAQIAMAQLQEYTVDCSSGIAWDNSTKTLYVVNGTTVHLFDFDPTAQTLSYGTGSAAEILSVSATALAAEHITDMNVTLEEGKAEITLNMQRNNKTFDATQVIALRNQPKYATSWTLLWNELTA